ncbi:MAG: hypothetical protein ABIB11_01380, partial [Candidatus Omnitrophota bacterium]
HMCTGVDWKLTENVSLNLDGKYTWAVSETSESISDPGSTLSFEDIDMDNIAIRAGISYRF